MHLPLSRLTPLRLAGVLLAMAGLLAACDRHSADELPESYGHGSSHQKSYSDHQADSRPESRSFSDSQGIDVGSEKQATPAVQPSASPAATAPGHFFPNGN